MTISADPAARPVAEAGGVLLTDLLTGAGTLAAQLDAALRAGQWLDAFLLAAGLSQLVEDRLHPDPFMLSRAASYLRERPSAPLRAAGRAAGAAAAVARLRPDPARAPLRAAREALATATRLLAAQVLDAGPAPDCAPLLAPVTAALATLAGEVVRLPACFHSFDQHPDDVRWLAREFRQRYPGPQMPLCVVGLRTSGSYLAPLHAAALAPAGERPPGVLTYRPGRPFLPWERAALRAVAQAGGLVLITDDPPGAGTALAAAAHAITAAGVPPSQIVFLLSVFGAAAELPPALSGWPAVLQPWPEWSVHRRLAAGPVRQALDELTGPDIEVAGITALGTVTGGERGHLRARFSVRFRDRRSGAASCREILAEGAGLGYLGRQSMAVAGALADHLPRVYGFRDGVLYRDWLPPAQQAPAAGPALAGTVARYVLARQRALPAPSAAVRQLGGRDPAWEVAARRLSGQFGPLAVPSRPLLLDPLVRRLLGGGQQAVVDGKTDPRHWLPDPAADGGLRKVDFYQRTFGHLDLACYDPVFDLAGAAAAPAAAAFEGQLRAAYHRLGGQPVDSERWLLYRLAQLWRLGCAGDLAPREVRQRSAAAVHDYLAGLYLPGLPPADGPLCAIDLDGVLECDRLGYPATSPTGMMALRSLIAHGYRPVLVSGRSLPEIRDRCLTFGLAGGVAEYGAVMLAGGTVTDMRPADLRGLLGEIRSELAACPQTEVDPRYQYTVRARAGGGPVPAALLWRITALRHPAVQVIHGEGQTDITVAGADKGTGLRALAARLGDAPCALAVGDSAPDLPMLAAAGMARAPRNAGLPASGRDVKRTRGAYQAGLADACAALLGHRPGGCAACRVPAFSPRTRAVLAVLDLRANGLASIPARTAALGALLLRSKQW